MASDDVREIVFAVYHAGGASHWISRDELGDRRERGHNGAESVPPVTASPEVAQLVRRLESRVLHLCQPSKALDARWRAEWASVSEDIRALQDLVATL
jgi:hypothetical protein